MSNLCRRCKKPFVAEHQVMTVRGTVVARSRLCPDCSPNMGAKPDAEMDCHRYILPHRLTARLRDGFEMLTEDPT